MPSKTIWSVRQLCSPSGVFQRRADSKNWFGFLMGKGFSYHISADAVKARLDAEREECAV